MGKAWVLPLKFRKVFYHITGIGCIIKFLFFNFSIHQYASLSRKSATCMVMIQ